MAVHLPNDVADSVADLALHYDIVSTDRRGANGFTLLSYFGFALGFWIGNSTGLRRVSSRRGALLSFA
jgi:hypothetical protein